jgi:hypothetical protein
MTCGTMTRADVAPQRDRVASAFGLALLTASEFRVFERLLFQIPADYGFTLESVSGVLSGRPVLKSWAHRVLAPFAVDRLGALVGDRVRTLELFFAAALLGANALLFVLLRRKGLPLSTSFLGVALFGLARLLLVFKLEYPWDDVDVLIFLGFGYWASQGRSLVSFLPVVALGVFNHETILYVPFWYLIAAFVPETAAPAAETSSIQLRNGVSRRNTLAVGALTAVAVVAAVGAMRARFYVGRPDLPDQVFVDPTPVIANQTNLVHNLRELFVRDWFHVRFPIAAAFFAAIGTLGYLAMCGIRRVAALWSLGILASILCFGYVNETRHYLLLVAFWFAYAFGEHTGEDRSYG